MEKKYFEMPGMKIPGEEIQTSPEDIRNAGRNPESLERLKAAALMHRDIGDGNEALLLPKAATYVPGAGLDTMVFVAKKNGVTGSVVDLTPAQLKEIFTIGTRTQGVYRRHTSESDPVVREAMVVNYHFDPLAQEAFSRKLFAQTLKDLHVHVLGWRKGDMESMREVSGKALLQIERDDIHEPVAFIVKRMLRVPAIQRELTKDLSVLRLVQDETLPGITFRAPSGEVTSEAFSADVQKVHMNTERLYKEVAGIFVGESQDSSGMPALKLVDEQRAALTAFMEKMRAAGDGEEKNFQVLERALRGLGEFLVSGEEVQAMTKEEREKTRIFLRNFAYTMGVIHDVGSDEVRVNMAPRLFSTGNMTATLGYFKRNVADGTSEWLEKRRAMHEHIREEFSENAGKE